MNKPKFFFIIGFLLSLLIGAGIGYRFGARNEKVVVLESQKLRPAVSKYTFINPLLGFDFVEKREFDEFQPLKKEVNKFIDEKIQTSKAADISVYFRNVRNGHWMGINEKKKYEPASLFKVPVMIAYLKEAERNPDILKKKIFFNIPVKNEHPEYVIEPSKLIADKAYTVEELITSMIIDSDNNALKLLMENMDSLYLGDLFSDLGVEIPQDDTYGINAKTYSLFFRTLYNATILNREMSERALELLSKTAFHNGITKNLPKNFFVAHKYGEHGIYNEKNVLAAIQFHDCGIIYYPQDPYFLCIMTQGFNIQELENIVQEVSDMVYQEVNSQAIISR